MTGSLWKKNQPRLIGCRNRFRRDIHGGEAVESATDVQAILSGYVNQWGHGG